VTVVSTVWYFELTLAALCISEENMKPLLCDTNNKFSVITIAVHCIRDNCKRIGKISGMRANRYKGICGKAQSGSKIINGMCIKKFNTTHNDVT
jgi:hypothetical protein